MNYISSRRRTRRGPLKGDVQEEGQGEEWSDTGCHPPWHLPACQHFYVLILCLRLFSFILINHSNLSLRLLPSEDGHQVGLQGVLQGLLQGVRWTQEESSMSQVSLIEV